MDQVLTERNSRPRALERAVSHLQGEEEERESVRGTPVQLWEGLFCFPTSTKIVPRTGCTVRAHRQQLTAKRKTMRAAQGNK